MLTKRFTYTLANVDRGTWVLYAPGGALVDFYPGTRAEALYRVGRLLASFAELFDQLSELRIERRDGGYAKETRTYPRKTDPKRSKG